MSGDSWAKKKKKSKGFKWTKTPPRLQTGVEPVPSQGDRGFESDYSISAEKCSNGSDDDDDLYAGKKGNHSR